MTLRDGRVLLVGGPTEGFYTAQIWDPNTGQWEIAGRPTTDIDPWGSRHDAVVLSDGRVLVTLTTTPPLGGVTHTEAEIYDPDSGVFRQIFDPFLLDHPLPYLTLPVVMSDERVLLATSLRGGVVFDPADESFTSVGERESYSETDLTAAALNDGRVLLVDPMGAAVYDPVTDDVTSVKPVYPTNRGVALALLQDGRVLVTGGEEWSYEDARDLGSIHAQVFDPKTGRFAAVGSMVEPRSHHSAATLADGRVVVVGGAGDRVEVFDPETATFKRAPLLTRPRNNPSVVRLDDGTCSWWEGGGTSRGHL